MHRGAQLTEQIILVNENDKEIGFADKMEAHIRGELHRAFSIFVFNSDGKMLIHRRALSKYHSGGLWTNTCCSHPRKGESLNEAAHRRLQEEMGFDCPLEEIFSFMYRKELDRDLIENEYDHVFIGEFNGQPSPNPSEVEEYAWIDPNAAITDIKEKPEKYSYWFTLALERVINSTFPQHIKKP